MSPGLDKFDEISATFMSNLRPWNRYDLTVSALQLQAEYDRPWYTIEERGKSHGQQRPSLTSTTSSSRVCCLISIGMVVTRSWLTSAIMRRDLWELNDQFASPRGIQKENWKSNKLHVVDTGHEPPSLFLILSLLSEKSRTTDNNITLVITF